MDNVTKNKIEQIISSLETETINIATKIDLNKKPSDNYSRSRDLMNIGSVILWLKKNLNSNQSNEEIKEKIQLFEEVINDKRYKTAGLISEISFLTNQLSTEALDEKEQKKIIDQIIVLDEKKLYKTDELKTLPSDKLESKIQSISAESSKDAARMLKSLLNDKTYLKKVNTSGYRIDERFLNAEFHHKESLLNQINNSIDIVNQLKKIIKKII